MYLQTCISNNIPKANGCHFYGLQAAVAAILKLENLQQRKYCVK